MKHPYRSPKFLFLNVCVRLLPIRPKYYRNHVLVENEISKVSINKDEVGRDFCGLIGVEDFKKSVFGDEWLDLSVYEKRLDAGHTCFGIKRDGKLIATNWASHQFACHVFGTENSFETFPLSGDEAFVYDAYVLPAYRGQGVALKLKNHFYSYLYRSGVQKTVSTVEFWNIPALRMQMKSGSVPVGMEHIYRLGRWKKWYFGTNKEKREISKWWDSIKDEAVKE